MQQPLAIVGAPAIRDIIRRHAHEIERIVGEAYVLHAQGQAVNPPSQFLRFPHKPEARIISLPAYVGGAVDTSGVKWIASFPKNTRQGIPRASAVLALNRMDTGYPYAVLESSLISATRTAASAVLAASRLSGARSARTAAFIGNGLIARHLLDTFLAVGWRFDEALAHDLDPAAAARFAAYLESRGVRAGASGSAADAVRRSDLVVLATTAAAPHLASAADFAHGPLVLNVSLRDLGPEVILASQNFVDDVEHCLTAQTSPHLAAQQAGHHDFIHGTIADLLTGKAAPDLGRTRVLSPFGMGVLDVALGAYIERVARAEGRCLEVPGFFDQVEAW